MQLEYLAEDQKTQLLKRAGYTYDVEREIYRNRKARKAFSIDFIEENDVKNIERCLAENSPQTGWHFYFTEEPSPTVRRKLESLLSNGQSQR
jgi:hypothetical protein